MMLTTDSRLLFATRSIRLFAYGFLSVVLVLYLAKLGFSETAIGILLTCTLIGDTLISLWLTTVADRLGRKRMLVIGAVLMVLAGIFFAFSSNYFVLLAAATLGVISPSGNEVGPFLPIEQAALSQSIDDQHRTGVFAWYNLVGSFATALGALTSGWLAHGLTSAGVAPLSAYRIVLIGYAVAGAVLFMLFIRLSSAIEAPPPSTPTEQRTGDSLFGLHHSQSVVLKLSGLFALDAFGGGFVIQSIVAYWFYVRFGVSVATLGTLFFAANILAGFSALAAARIASRFGLINTMVFTHIPSNVLLMLVPLMPNLPLAIAVLLVRFSISQMDVPTRQSFVMAVVRPEERSAAAGITGVARTTGSALAPIFTGLLMSHPALFNAPFFLAGGLKIVYDLLLYKAFKTIQPAGEHTT